LIYAQVLTNWGSLEKAGNAAAPSAGQVAMWIIAASQWVAGLCGNHAVSSAILRNIAWTFVNLHRTDAVTATTSRQWRGAPEI
jgi:hypothetical protein